ncbi:MAG TPA: alpha/beta hydrolase domain-containing protein [Terriglobia bacterium]|nr:alpha/beta hydrolase domain-containing protein [Terriglobia bacterium]
MLAAIVTLLLAVNATPVPKVTGPIPVTADSYPFLAANHDTPSIDLSKLGYVEEEYIVTGNANVYDWAADGTLSAKIPNAPYGTRILVRRPKDAARFSGSVMVELLFPARRFDWSMMWGFSHDYLLEHGDAWVGISLPAVADGLKKFNPTRYAAVSFANPTPNAPCGNNAAPASEEGLRWDMISQVGALLKSNVAGRPLAGFPVQALYLTTQGSDVATYANAIHANLENGKPVYDGYLLKAGFNMTRISQCAQAPAANDPRQAIKNVGVPVIEVAAQGEVIGGTLASRRPDSDESNDRFRLYEVASAGHIDKSAYFGFPAQQDQVAAVGNAQGTVDWPFNAKCEPEIPLMEPSLMGLVFNSSLASLDQWVKKGTPAPRAARIELMNPGTPQVSFQTDKLGHGLGGVRTAYIDVPDATYFMSSPGPGTCREMGHKVPYDAARITELYGSRRGYVSRFTETVDRLVKERWLIEGDAKRLKQGLTASSN